MFVWLCEQQNDHWDQVKNEHPIGAEFSENATDLPFVTSWCELALRWCIKVMHLPNGFGASCRVGSFPLSHVECDQSHLNSGKSEF